MAILGIPVKRQNAWKKEKRVLFSCYDMYHIHQESWREAKRELDDFLSVAWDDNSFLSYYYIDKWRVKWQ